MCDSIGVLCEATLLTPGWAARTELTDESTQVKSAGSADILFPDWNFHERALHWHANSSWRMDAVGLAERYEWRCKPSRFP